VKGTRVPSFIVFKCWKDIMITEKKIRGIAEEKLDGTGMFVVDVLAKPSNKIYVFIDGDSGVTISDCIELSRHIEGRLDRDKEDFELNVSSSGVDQPLKIPRQYKKHIGKKISVLTQDGKKQEGELLNVLDNGISFMPGVKGKKKKKEKTEPVFVSFEDIKETKRLVSFKR